MTRRNPLLQVGICTLLTGASVAWAAAAGSRPNIRPNIVFILADDLGWADIGYHNPQILTPNLNRLASGGVRLEQHYVYPTCSPTRVGLLTGRVPSRFGVLGPLGARGAVPPKTPTLASILRRCGYTTHISGKWHLGSLPQYRPLHYGFDTSYGYLRGQIDPWTHRYKLGDRTWHRNDELIDEPGHATDLITDEAVRIIRMKHDQPFLLYVAYSVPHYPLAEPDRWTSLYNGRITDQWRRLFAASVTHMDAAVGRILAALEQTGQRDNTIVIFTSDNGGQRSWNAPRTHYRGRYKPHTTLGCNLPLRGWKGDLHEGGIRVPALISWPGHVPKGKIIEAPACILDWMPTLCRLAGYQLSPELHLEGMDIWPLATGEAEVLRPFIAVSYTHLTLPTN